MNRTYRLIFNRALGLWQVASELVRSPSGQGAGEGGVKAVAIRPLDFALWVCLGWVAVVPAWAQQAGERMHHAPAVSGHEVLQRARHQELSRAEVTRHQVRPEAAPHRARHDDARGRIITDPDAPGRYRPTVLEGANGLSLVNITTPSAAGVSRNVYTQFDVNPEGVILNNSRTQVETELGGWVQGNPWLATGTARVILNEVNSSDPSRLRGYVEVGGDRAQVVIANPAGIDCDGCGFINASQLTLTTGVPVVEQGVLEGYRVSGGTIVVDGAGLDATRTDYTDLIARSLWVNAGIWAERLQVTAGANAVDAASSGVEPIATEAAGPAPGFAIDVGALGGMYAGKITLRGTEHGVGVRNAGNIGAQVGELAVTVDGRLENTGALQSRQDNTRINAAGGVTNAGILGAAGELQVSTAADLDNTGGTLNAPRIEVTAESLHNDGGAIEQTGAQALVLEAGTLSNRDGGRIGIAAAPAGGTPGGGSTPDSGNDPGEVGRPGDDDLADGGGDPGEGALPPAPEPLADGVLRIATVVNNDGGHINAGGGVALSVADGVDNSGGHLGLRALTLDSGYLGNAAGELLISGDANLQLGHLDNDGGRLEVAGALRIGAEGFSNRAGTVAHGGVEAATISVTDTFDNSAGTLASNATRLEINSDILVNEDGRIEHAGAHGLDLRAGTLAGQGGEIVSSGEATVRVAIADHRGATFAADRITLDAEGFDNRGGILVATGANSSMLVARDFFDNGDGGVVSTSGDLLIRAATFGNVHGSLGQSGDGELSIDVGVFDGTGGSIATAGVLHMRGDTIDLGAGTTAAQQVDIRAGDLRTAGGSLTASGGEVLALHVERTLDNSAGTIAGNGALDLSADALVNRDGVIQSAGTQATTLEVHGSFDNAEGTVAAAGDLALGAAELVNAGGVVLAVDGAGLQVTIDGLLDNSDDGLLAAEGDMGIVADILDNAAGRIEHSGEGTLSINARVIDGAGGAILGNGALALAGDSINLRDGTTAAQRMTIQAGDLTTAGGSLVASGGEPLVLQVERTLDNTAGTIAGNGALALSAGAVHNRDGSIQAAGTQATTVQVSGVLDNAGGVLAAAGDIALGAGDLINAGGVVQAVDGARLQVTVDGLLDNSDDGLMASDGDLDIAADTLDNAAGRIEHAGEGTLAIDARVVDGAGGAILGNGALALSGDTVDLRDGTTAAQRIGIQAGDLTTAGGSLVASSGDALVLQVDRTLDNSAGTIAGNGALELSAGALRNRDGVIQAAGAEATTVQVAGSFDNAGGIVAAAGETALHAGELINTAGVVQVAGEADLSITSDGSLFNDAGLIAGNGAITLQALALDNQEGLIQARETLAATMAGLLDNSRGAMIAGGDLMLQANILRNRDTSVSSGLGLFGANLVLDAATVDNRLGRVVAGETVALAAVSLDNTGGDIRGAGAVDVVADNLVNAGGSLVQGGGDGTLTMQVSGLLDNTAGGLIGAEGAADVAAGTLDNSAGTVFAQDALDIASAGDVLNREGGLLQTGGTLDLQAQGALDNSGGDIDATGGASIGAARIDNVQGRVLAGTADDQGAALSLSTAGTLDNRGGVIGSRGGDLALQAARIDNRSDGVLTAGRDLALDTAVVDNAGGTVYASRHLRFENSTATLDNRGGRFGAGDTAWLDLAQVDNRNDGRIQADTLWLTSAAVDNAGGDISANVLHARFDVLAGAGRIYGAQGLNLHFSGDFTYLQDQRLESDGALGLNVAGTFTNLGILQSASELAITAVDVINAGTLNASNAWGTGVNRIVASGDIDNRDGGRIEGDSVELEARDVNNTGDIVGDTVTIAADTLTNGRDLGQALAERDYGEGFIGAAQHLELRIGDRLSNLDGELFSAGDLVVAGRGPDDSTVLVENISGRIQAEGDLSVAADAIVNARRVLRTEHRAYVGQEQLDDPDAGVSAEDTVPYDLQDIYCGDGFRTYCMYFDGYTQHESRVLEGTRVLEASAAGQIVSGGDMLLTGSLDNVYSAIAAGGALTIAGFTPGDSDDPGDWSGVVNNVALSGYKMIEQTSTAHISYQTCDVGMNCHVEPRELTVTFDAQTRRKDYVLAEGSATISAGRGVTIVAGDVSNTVVQAGDGLAGMGPGAVEGPGSTGLGTATGADAEAVDAIGAAQGIQVSGGAVGEAAAVGATGPAGFDGPAPQLVGTPEAPLPGLVPPDNGMFDLHADPDAPFMVTTAPRFAPDGSIGSDHLLGQLGFGSDLHKRLGDGHYEQRLVLDQLLRLTGRRTLDGSDGLAQYRTLMDNAAQTASALGLELGAPLTASQIGALDQDIVWLVEQEVDGQTVLVPVVYLSQATANRLRGEGALIAGADVAVQSSGTVRNDGQFSGDRSLWLAADTLINDGALRGGALLAVATAGDTVNRGRMTGGDVVVDAGRDFVQTSSGSLQATGSAVVGAGRDLRLEATTVAAGEQLVLGAGRDLTVDASDVTAGSDMALVAGRDLSVTARTQHATTAHGNTVSTHELLQASTLQAGGDMALQAGRDLGLEAAQVQAGGSLALSAGRDLNLSAVTTTDTSLTEVERRRFQQRTFTSDQTVHGTSLEAGGDITMVAGRDATLTAAQVFSEEGGIAVGAGRDLTLAAAEQTHEFEQDTVSRRRGLLSSRTTTTHESSTETYAVGTTLSGERVGLVAGNDLTLQAATVAGTGDVRLAAGNDLTIEGAYNTLSESHSSHTRRSGIFGSGGIGFTIGTQTRETTADMDEITYTGSLIGSTDGRVDIAAGGDVTVTGSDVLSREGIGIVGSNVTIQAADDVTELTETQKFRQAGLNVSLSGAAVDAAMAVYSSTRRAGQVEDSRLAALNAAQAGQTLYFGGAQAMADAGNQLQALGETIRTGEAQGGQGGINLRIGIGASSSDSRMEYTGSTAAGSRIASEGDVTILATGNGEGEGGDLSIIGSQVEGENVTLAAARDLLLQSQRESHEQIERNRSSSGEIGVTIGTDAGMGVYVSAAAARGRGDGSGTTHQETVVQASDTLTLVSGRDTTLEGAQAIGETVVADIGRDLTMISQQDTSAYSREDQSASIDVAVGVGGGSVSGSYHQSNIDSNYTSVREQTGIQAGAGGFDITVGGHTELVGAAIASLADPSRNRFSTGSLSANDLHNEAAYSASSFGFSAGSSGGGGSFSPSVGMSQSESANSTTRSGISEGLIEIRDGGTSALASLDRSVTQLQQDGLGEIFDERRVAERMEMGQMAGEVGFRAAGDLAGRMGWEEGSPERAALHGAVGAAMSALGGGSAMDGATGAVANQMAFNAMRDYFTSQLDLEEGGAAFNAMMELGSLAVGAAVSGRAGSATALSATQNNYLTHQQIEMLQMELGQCELVGGCDAVVQKYIELSQLQDQALLQVCATAPGGDVCQNGIRQALNYAGDTSWKSYEVRLGADWEPDRVPLDQLDIDIERARDVVLDITMSNRTAYGAVNDIEPRADFFGAMYQATGAAWFGAAEDTSRTELQGLLYGVGSLLSDVGAWGPFAWTGSKTLDEWRNAAGDQIMARGYSEFLKVYTETWADMDEWSQRQLSNEQRDPELQRIHEAYVPGFSAPLKWGIEWRGNVKDILDPDERIITGCRRMGFDEDCVK